MHMHTKGSRFEGQLLGQTVRRDTYMCVLLDPVLYFFCRILADEQFRAVLYQLLQ